MHEEEKSFKSSIDSYIQNMGEMGSPSKEDPISSFVSQLNANFIALKESIKNSNCCHSALVAVLVNKGILKEDDLDDISKMYIKLLAYADQEEMKRKKEQNNGTTKQ